MVPAGGQAPSTDPKGWRASLSGGARTSIRLFARCAAWDKEPNPSSSIDVGQRPPHWAVLTPAPRRAGARLAQRPAKGGRGARGCNEPGDQLTFCAAQGLPGPGARTEGPRAWTLLPSFLYLSWPLQG